jgi:hypothetical protein
MGKDSEVDVEQPFLDAPSQSAAFPSHQSMPDPSYLADKHVRARTPTLKLVAFGGIGTVRVVRVLRIHRLDRTPLELGRPGIRPLGSLLSFIFTRGSSLTAAQIVN